MPMEHLQEEQLLDTNYPSLLKRVQSIFIDGCLLIIVMFTFAWIVGDNDTMPGWVKGLIFYGYWVLYEPICTAFAGATLGNFLIGIRVRKVNDRSQKISLLSAFIRVIVKSLFGWLSFISIHFNEQKRTLHDLASGSVMLEVSQLPEQKLKVA
jgi:uncharacterized RDD family membrane protein YckC